MGQEPGQRVFSRFAGQSAAKTWLCYVLQRAVVRRDAIPFDVYPRPWIHVHVEVPGRLPVARCYDFRRDRHLGMSARGRRALQAIERGLLRPRDARVRPPGEG